MLSVDSVQDAMVEEEGGDRLGGGFSLGAFRFN